MAGLPTWVWLALAAGGIGVGFYLRSRNHENEGVDSEDPCDEASASYNPEKCNGVSESGLTAGYDSADPCDPTSVTYDPAACQATAGLGYESVGGGGGPGGYQIMGPEAPYPTEAAPPMEPTPTELATAEEGGIEPGSSPLVTITQNIHAGGKPCNKRKKPKGKKGFNIVCANGKWAYEPASHAGKDKKNPTKHLTGGGAPHKKHNKTHPHGKHRKHKAKQ